MIFVVLLDQEAPAKTVVQDWLNSNGLITWLANDVPHAIEELSDFTVRNRPDVVLVEVTGLDDSFDALRSAFNTSTSTSDVTVLGMGVTSGNPCFAQNFDQLNELLQCKSN